MVELANALDCTAGIREDEGQSPPSTPSSLATGNWTHVLPEWSLVEGHAPSGVMREIFKADNPTCSMFIMTLLMSILGRFVGVFWTMGLL